ncbi:MAG: O-Antigen ligase [Firmicutes bacterium ADurb.Bin419]|nr:MAG: O-Antigen ligase [Firmicutes bacterium ADurb.Bin419]
MTKAKKKISINNKYSRVLMLFIIVAIFIVMFCTPFLQGLYFEKDQYPTEILVFSTFIIFWIYKMIKKTNLTLSNPLEYAAFGFCLAYFISIFVAASIRSAIGEWLKYCMYFAVFFMLSDLVNNYRKKITLLWILAASSLGVSILGIDSAFGGSIVNFVNSIFSLLGSDFNFFGLYVDGRIHSTFQYPNTLAAYLLVVFFISIALMVTHSKLWVKSVAGIFGTFYIVTFLLTISRGTYILLPVVLLLFLLVLPKDYKIQGAIYCFATLLSGVTVTGISYLINNQVKTLLVVLVGIALSVIVNLLSEYAIKLSKRIGLKRCIIAFASLVIILILSVIYLFNSIEPLSFSHSINQENSFIINTKTVELTPEKEYKLVFDAQAANELNADYAFFIEIFAKNKNDIILGKTQKVASYSCKSTNGIEQQEVIFNIPNDMSVVDIKFINYHKGTSVTFDNARVIDKQSGKIVKRLALKYRYFNNIISRFEGITNSKNSIQRSIYIKDGFKMFKDSWLLGSGGGAWLQKYFSYQSFNYSSTQAHNFLLQLATDCGIVGLLCYLLLLLGIVSAFVKEYRFKSIDNIKNRVVQGAIFTSISVLIMHSVFDFDLSFPAVSLVLWALLALFNVRSKEEICEENIQYKYPVISKFINLFSKINKLKQFSLHPIIGMIGSVIILVLPITFMVAANYSDKSGDFAKKDDINSAIKYMKKSADTDVFKPEYKVDYVKLLTSKESVTKDDLTQANKYITRAESFSIYNTNLRTKIAEFYFRTGKIDKALDYIDSLVDYRPYVVEIWQQKASVYYQLVMMYLQQNEKEKALKYIDMTLGIIDEAREKNKGNLAPFKFNDSTIEILEKLDYIKKNINENMQADINRIIFYSMPEIDVNLDNIPDQWDLSGSGDAKLSYSDKSIIAEAANGVLISRKLKFKPDTKYRIELKMTNLEAQSQVSYSLDGITEHAEYFKQDKDILSAEITLPQGTKDFESVLRIIVNGKYEILEVMIEEI